MRSSNVTIANPYIGQSADRLIANILHAIETLGKTVQYYSYDEEAEEFKSPISIPAYLQNIEDKNQPSGLTYLISVDKSFDIIFSTKSFYDNNIIPDEEDKYVYNGDTYYVDDPQYINAFQQSTDLLANSVLITFKSVKKDTIKRSQI